MGLGERKLPHFRQFFFSIWPNGSSINTHTFTGRQHVCKKYHHFTCNQNKMAKTHSCSNRIIYGRIYVHPQEIVRQIVSLGQITNIIYHVYICNNKNKLFPS